MEVGEYLDPGLVATTSGDVIINPSWGWGVMSARSGETYVPLVDGRTAIVDSEGIIIGFK